ncbi:hypothetical protein [Flagellimonas pacifica]|uniref:Peptidase S74 domain-containing protein n=1 Tax=Flagellimonas pacifica TaxID=1247520 RepID=A0A285MT27_9FLAO|nr:hypothetical protein [Allomuricauda parva]SNY99687.1 hypothetical protein SAMN06265377_1498 [Allomuricauda parva]
MNLKIELAILLCISFLLIPTKTSSQHLVPENEIRFSESRGFDYDPNTDSVYFNDYNNGKVITFGIGGNISNNGFLSTQGTIWAIGNKIRFSEDRGFDYDPNTDSVYFNDYNNGQVVTFAHGGSVGIGTTAPSSKLHIKNPNGGAALAVERGGKSWNFSIQHTGNNLFINNSSNPSTFFTYTNTGRFGIGTTSPDSELAVNGNIHAKEVKVDLIGWPDYVFKEEYDVPTLEEVEKYIHENGHLINIPSAEEVEENGIQLGEMNRLLLEKIEELTLYVLELKKENEIQQQEIENLKNNNNEKPQD